MSEILEKFKNELGTRNVSRRPRLGDNYVRVQLQKSNGQFMVTIPRGLARCLRLQAGDAYSDLSGTSLRFYPAPQYDFIRHFVIGAKRRSLKISRVPDGTPQNHHFEHTLFHLFFQSKKNILS